MLDKIEIVEGNKVIAKLMGWEETTHLNGAPRSFIPYIGDVDITNLNYHDSWDWIMPVATKINGLGKEYSLAIFKNYVSLTVEKGGKVYKDFSFAHAEYITTEQTGKEAIFKLIVKFIKWYNENILAKNLVESK